MSERDVAEIKLNEKAKFTDAATIAEAIRAKDYDVAEHPEDGTIYVYVGDK